MTDTAETLQDVPELLALQSDRRLGRLITRVEMNVGGSAVLGVSLPPVAPLNVQVIGVTGPPGAGKSTVVDQLIELGRSEGLSVGVLAVDPSSPFSGGAVLGDRIRMGRHASDPGVFIRSLGTRAASGGLAAALPTAVRLLTASGRNLVIVETVGVGQAELDIMHVADTTLVVTIPGLGDTVQMNKAGIMEIADVFAVNMADKDGAAATVRDIRQAVHIGKPKGWTPPVVRTVGTSGEGIEELWNCLRQHFSYLIDNELLMELRRSRLRDEVEGIILRAIEKYVRKWTASPELDALMISIDGYSSSPESTAARAMRYVFRNLQQEVEAHGNQQ